MRKPVMLLCTLVLCVVSLFGANDPFSYPLGTVIIDAGHGGHDPGATNAWSFAGGTVYERDLTLDIAKRLQALLAVTHPSLQLVMTRDDDRYISLEDRCQIAYRTPLQPQTSSLFISIHVNSATTDQASGFEVLTKEQEKRVTLLDAMTPIENIPLFSSYSQLALNRLLNQRNLVVASVFEQTLEASLVTGRNRGVKERDLWVLNGARMPAVL
ncbi:MAG: N-acetylmuramoyl-L-alanine amidase, partial [Sphaerochaetaceae bacterium]